MSKVSVEKGRKRVKRGLRRPLAEWDVLLKDQHEGYITWSEFERNQRVIADNATGKGALAKGAVRRGELLLAGLLRCGHCGRKMYVGYGGKAEKSERSRRRSLPGAAIRRLQRYGRSSSNCGRFHALATPRLRAISG